MLCNAAISRSSKRQTLVALSTEDAEYTAFTEASREALWLRQILLDVDNRGLGRAIKANHTNTEGITARIKHFDIYLKHARNLQQKGVVQFTYIKSTETRRTSSRRDYPYQGIAGISKTSVWALGRALTARTRRLRVISGDRDL